MIPAVNGLLAEYGSTPVISSGWRPREYNEELRDLHDKLIKEDKTPGFGKPAKRSNHILGVAVDLSDKDGKLDAWCMAHLDRLAHWGLYLEHPDSTKGWCHLQVISPRSGNRVFKP